MDIERQAATWQDLASQVLKQARDLGASAAEVSAGEGTGFTVSVRLGEVETLEYHQDKDVSVTVYFGQRKGTTSTSDISKAALTEALNAACHIARYTSEDPFAGLAEPALMAKNYPDLDLYHPWVIDTTDAMTLAKQCEEIGRSYDKRITNSEGANVATHQGIRVYGNTHGFIGAYPTTRHSMNCQLIAQLGQDMQRDYDYTVARDPHDLWPVAQVGKNAAERTIKRLGARRLKTCQVPVIFRADIATSLIGHFISAIRGSNLYRRASFLVDQLGKSIFNEKINIREEPHLKKGLGSAPFDAEGVRTNHHNLIQDGVLQSYVLNSYAARKLQMQSTGNAGGVHNVVVETQTCDFAELIKKMHKGLLVTELLGQGINIVTGDYSRGAAGFWVENGEIQYPVQEITIAGNLRELFKQIQAISNDVEQRSNIRTGSLLLEMMSIAGE